MIGKGTLVGLTIILFAAITGDVGAQADNGQVPEFYYYSSGERIALTLSTEIVGIRFEEGVSSEEQAAIVSTERGMRSFDDRLQWDMLEQERMVVVPLEPGATGRTVLAIIESLDAKRGVEFASPAFHTEPDYHELLTDRFYASFPDSVPEEDILALNAEHAVEIMEKKDYSETLGKVGYRLRVTRESGMNALDMANLYYEHPLTIGSNPNFQPLYPSISFFPPRIEIIAPSERGETAFYSFTIEWTDDDPLGMAPAHLEVDAAISLYYDTDQEGRDGTLIVSGISEDDETDEYIWDLSDVPSGTYWIYAEMYDRFYLFVQSRAATCAPERTQ